MTSPNQADFAPEVRAGAWWSGDSRKAANGRAADAILEKLGKKEPVDLSGIEAVQMGKIMEPTIARLFQDKHRIELKDADYALSHKDEPWGRLRPLGGLSCGKNLLCRKLPARLKSASPSPAL